MSDGETTNEDVKITVKFNMPCGKHIEPIEVNQNTTLADAMDTRKLNPLHYNVYSIIFYFLGLKRLKKV